MNMRRWANKQSSRFTKLVAWSGTLRTDDCTVSTISSSSELDEYTIDSSSVSLTMKNSESSSSSRRPLANLQSYPALAAEHEGSSINTSTESTLGKPVVPPKPILTTTRSTSTKPFRPRSGSAPGAQVAANLFASMIHPANNNTTSSSSSPSPSKRLEQAYSLQRSSSIQPKIPNFSGSSPDRHRRARSYSASYGSSPVGGSSSYGSSPTTSNDSISSLLSILEMRRHKYGETHPKVGSTYNRIGNLFFRSRQFSRALHAYKQAVACYPVGEPDLASSYLNIGTVYWASGRPDKAIAFLEKAVEIYELHEITEGRDPDESMAVASTLYQMGLCNTLQKKYGEALSCLKKCQKIQASVLPPRDIQVGRTLDAIGKVHYFKEEYSTALQCHEEARRIKSSSGDDDEVAIITSLLNIAAVHHATKNWSAALKNYTKVMHLQKSELVRCRNQKGQPLLARAAQEVGETMQLLGNLHNQMDQQEQAKRFLKEASLLFEEAGLSRDDSRVVALEK